MKYGKPKSEGIEHLKAIMAQLRDPANGCSWDIAQTFTSIAPYTIEEAYEVADAIRKADMDELCDELGDLLLQVVYLSQIAEEDSFFNFDAVVRQVTEKMIRRHPHVFDTDHVSDTASQAENWETQKAAERATKAAETGHSPSELDGIALGLPALSRAYKLQKRAARSGFDWPDSTAVLGKLNEEITELRAEIDTQNTSGIWEELGDLLFTVANLARKLGVDPEEALRESNAKFERRYRRMESQIANEGYNLQECTATMFNVFWEAVKSAERTVDEDKSSKT